MSGHFIDGRAWPALGMILSETSWRDKPDNSFCVQEVPHFGLRHVIAAGHTASATLQVQEKRIE